MGGRGGMEKYTGDGGGLCRGQLRGEVELSLKRSCFPFLGSRGKEAMGADGEGG